MKSLVGNGKDFKFNSKVNRKPMEIFKNRCNHCCQCRGTGAGLWHAFGVAVGLT